MKARLYRMFALFFAVMGVVIFISLYMSHVDGHFLEALRDPATVAVILVPFLPAVVLSLLAQKTERKFAALKPHENTPEPQTKK